MVVEFRRYINLLAVVTIVFTVFFVFNYDKTTQMILASGSPSSDLDKKPSEVIYRSKLLYQGEFNQNVAVGMSPEIGDETFYNFLFHRHYICEDSVRLGNVNDGGWDVCLACTYQLKKPCLVYSFGINHDFSFDDAVSKKYNCTVRAFDPSMNVADYKRDDNINFYRTGLGKTNQNSSEKSRGWRIRNFATLLEELGDSKRIVDYLKMDIELAEWESLESMFETNVLQTKVKQFALEIHLRDKSGFDEIYGRWKILKHFESIGFKRWYWHMNPACVYSFNGKQRSRCYELVYVNTAFLNSPPTTSAARNTSLC